MRAAAEAVEEALVVVDEEARALLVVEGAQAGEFPALLDRRTRRPTTAEQVRRLRISSRNWGGKAIALG
jgi:hypothetical protein